MKGPDSATTDRAGISPVLSLVSPELYSKLVVRACRGAFALHLAPLAPPCYLLCGAHFLAILPALGAQVCCLNVQLRCHSDTYGATACTAKEPPEAARTYHAASSDVLAV
ncbi:hypothetical protein FS749_000232 [Ceratobasidium sp. UAMH 11750]|nr:hypothetical protein FS749_000232 [Ceratobasidium sp. UAMH 11750]